MISKRRNYAEQKKVYEDQTKAAGHHMLGCAMPLHWTAARPSRAGKRRRRAAPAEGESEG